jgi:VCBS repeat protein
MRIVCGWLCALLAVSVLAACGGDDGRRSAKARPSATKLSPLVIDIKGNEDECKRLLIEVLGKSPKDVRFNTAACKRLLIEALGRENTTVRLAEGVDMDLSGYEEIPIKEGVTLTSVASDELVAKSRTNVRGPPGSVFGGESARNAQKLGPRIYTKTRPKPLFLIRCNPEAEGQTGDNVRISGFRLIGPHFETEEGYENEEKGITIDGCVGIEITNMEIAGWSGQAIYIIDLDHPRISEPEQVRIHDNFIHHNQHKGGNGYGVVTQQGAYALIQRNVFDFNRHAIASSGISDPGKETGYRAEQNLVLRGGGVHGRFYNEHTHQFDVHGDRSCGIGDKNCGWAGNRYWMMYNAFQYVIDNAIKLRGKPRESAYIQHNVFPHISFEGIAGIAAVALRTRKNVYGGSGDNTLGVDTFGQYGVCDFDGDGKDDLFLPTGVTWWYSSAGKMHWTYLNAANELLGQVGLGYFDGDKRCDVFAVHGNEWEISSGGTSTWRSLGTYGVPFDQLRFGNFNSSRNQPAGRRALTDIFRRDPNGRWSVVAPGSHDWRVLGSSSFPLSQLRFGDFTGDGITDVLSVEKGRWAISRSGTGQWEELNPKISTPVESVLIADLDANGKDDVAQLSTYTWQVSWDGRSEWKNVTTLSSLQTLEKGSFPRFAGYFDNLAGADLLLVDGTRFGRLYSKATDTVVVHNLFAY